MLENDDSVAAQGKRLKYLRKKIARMNTTALSEEADVGRTSISLWEGGKTENPMTPTSRSKLLSAFKKRGIEVTERWLVEGVGDAPKVVNQSSALEKTPTYINEKAEKNPSTNIHLEVEKLKFKLAANISSEIVQFTSLTESTVITKVGHSGFAPLLKPGTLVGGLWQSSALLLEEEICIIKLNDQLQVAHVRKGIKEGSFDISYNWIETQEPYVPAIKNFFLEMVAPIVRVWRQETFTN